ncbi:J domain-containing protein [Bradyrhizobium sp.]|uniref:J domain-containing protein n=1 Tax=Bradyrhizobium sp. TaxID=376 RepID=UPI002620A5AE|nr:J domain-containing protein [Bradyrhizobium sp.]
MGVSQHATATEIKAAYRTRAKELHPDRNQAQDASAQFRLLNKAYEVLSDPTSRASYDTIVLETANDPVTGAHHSKPESIVCSSCGKLSAQPRYAIFFAVKSFLLLTRRSPVQGIFCSACAEKKAYRASAVTWLLGWWGFPWGPIYSAHAIITNMLGGKRPADVNARLAAYQAWYFVAVGKMNLAQAVAMDAAELARLVPSNSAGAELGGTLDQLLRATGASTNRLKNSWRLLSRPFYVQAGSIAVIALGIWLGYENTPASQPPRGPKTYVGNLSATPPTSDLKRRTYVRPATAPNGNPWPTVAGYLPGFPRLNTDGNSTIAVDNGQNDSDVFVKLVSLSSANAYPVRQFFIPAGRSFRLESLRQGTYDIRYQDLSSGSLSRSAELSVTETRTYQGIRYTDLRLTLYKVRNGNMQMYTLSADEF